MWPIILGRGYTHVNVSISGINVLFLSVKDWFPRLLMKLFIYLSPPLSLSVSHLPFHSSSVHQKGQMPKVATLNKWDANPF